MKVHGCVRALPHLLHGNIVDIGSGLGDCGGHSRQYAALIGHHHLDADLELPADFFAPATSSQFSELPRFFEIGRTVMGMNHQPLIFFDKADNGIPRDGAAAFRKLHCHAFSPKYGDDVASPARAVRRILPAPPAALRSPPAGAFPSPISASKSFLDLAPLSRASFSHCAALMVCGSTLSEIKA